MGFKTVQGFTFSLLNFKTIQIKSFSSTNIIFLSVSCPGSIEYQAQSPDEAALVSAARNFGFVFKVSINKFQFSYSEENVSKPPMLHI